MTQVLMLLAGCALAVWDTWHFLGRSPRARAWSRSSQDDKPRQILVAWPLLSLVLLCGAVLGVADDLAPLRNAASLLLLVSAVLAVLYLAFPLPVPGWLRPRWYDGVMAQRGSRG